MSGNDAFMPAGVLAPLNMEARSTDDFPADRIALDPGRAVAAIRRMRERLKRPEITAEGLLLRMEAEGLTQDRGRSAIPCPVASTLRPNPVP